MPDPYAPIPAGDLAATLARQTRLALARLDWACSGPEALNEAYRELLTMIGAAAPGQDRQSAPYNLLVTRRFMLAVPRLAESMHGISVNALGFAGSLFVRDAARLDAVCRLGPMSILCTVAGAAQP